MKQSKFPFLLCLVTIIVFLLDQATKMLFQDRSPTDVFGSLLSFHTTTNTGIAFSIPLTGIPLIIITIIILIIGFVFVKKHINLSLSFSQVICGMILGGALGNLFGRVFRGYVIDFIQIYSFPTFNIADMFITIGGVLFVAYYSRIELKK